MIKSSLKPLYLLAFALLLITCTKKDDTNNTTSTKCVISLLKEDGSPSRRATINGSNQITKLQVYDSTGVVTNYYVYEYNSDGKVSKMKIQDNNGNDQNYYTYEYSGGNVVKSHFFDYDNSSSTFIELSYTVYTYNSGKISKAEDFAAGSTTATSSTSYTTDGSGNVTKTTGTFSNSTLSGYDSKVNPYKGFMFFSGMLNEWYFNSNNPGTYTSGSTTYTYTYEYNSNNIPTKSTQIKNGISTVYTSEYSCK